MQAYELSAKPALLFSAAQSLRRLGGRRQEAMDLFELYLAEEGGTRKEDALKLVNELRGPAKTGDEAVDRKAAEKIFNRGAAHYQAGRYAQAYDDFCQAYELFPSPAILFSAAQSLRRLGGRSQEAIGLYELYLADEGGTRKADAQKHLDALRESGASP